MLFNSYEFILCYLPVTVLVFFILGKYSKQVATGWIVFASFSFYGYWDIKYIPLLAMSIVFNYIVGKSIEHKYHKKIFLWFGIILDVSLLGYFKYTDFFLQTIYGIGGVDCYDLPHIVLPLGISFFTFTQIAYLVDAYRGETRNQSFLTYCEFVTIFPHLIAGPIINHKKMLPQFLADKTFSVNYRNIGLGLSLFSMGLAKKVLIADALAPWVNSVFSNVHEINCVEAWIGALSYTLQLYFDFSGYSEMAIGLGLMVNLTIPQNFNSPYQATSIIDFWRRWHMTLGIWVRDYLYIPLGGNRFGELTKMRNLFASMLIIGLWHGAGWSYVFWGGTHGVLLIINHQWRRLKFALPNRINWLLTFLCVTICWVFFRADSLYEGLLVFKSMLDISSFALPNNAWYIDRFAEYGFSFDTWHIKASLGRCFISLVVLMLLVVKVKNPVAFMEEIKPSYKLLIFTNILFLVCLYYIGARGTGEFLYFQF